MEDHEKILTVIDALRCIRAASTITRFRETLVLYLAQRYFLGTYGKSLIPELFHVYHNQIILDSYNKIEKYREYYQVIINTNEAELAIKMIPEAGIEIITFVTKHLASLTAIETTDFFRSIPELNNGFFVFNNDFTLGETDAFKVLSVNHIFRIGPEHLQSSRDIFEGVC